MALSLSCSLALWIVLGHTHWSPWGPILQLDRLNYLWLETARWLNNKGGKDIATFWDQGKIEWVGVLETLRDGPLSVVMVVLLGRIEDILATIPMLIGMSDLDWKAWRWLGSSSFQKPPCKAVYKALMYR